MLNLLIYYHILNIPYPSCRSESKNCFPIRLHCNVTGCHAFKNVNRDQYHPQILLSSSDHLFSGSVICWLPVFFCTNLIWLCPTLVFSLKTRGSRPIFQCINAQQKIVSDLHFKYEIIRRYQHLNWGWKSVFLLKDYIH